MCIQTGEIFPSMDALGERLGLKQGQVSVRFQQRKDKPQVYIYGLHYTKLTENKDVNNEVWYKLRCTQTGQIFNSPFDIAFEFQVDIQKVVELMQVLGKKNQTGKRITYFALRGLHFQKYEENEDGDENDGDR